MLNLDKNTDKSYNDLIFLKPHCNKIWGGRRLAEEYGYDIPDGPVGCWAISAHLTETVKCLWCICWKNSFWTLKPTQSRAPLVMQREIASASSKILDAKDDLSVQVHPRWYVRSRTREWFSGERVLRCWYILDAREWRYCCRTNASSKEEFASWLSRKVDWALQLRSYQGWRFLRIDPGTVHAIRTGTLILETRNPMLRIASTTMTV